MKDIELPVPPTLAEQAAIVEYVRNATDPMLRAITDARREIDLIREYRTRLVADVVTGKVDVRGVVLPADADDGASEDAEFELQDDGDEAAEEESE